MSQPKNGGLYCYGYALQKRKMFFYEQDMESELYNWFKSSAREHIEKMRQYSQLLEAHDINVQQLTTTKSGVIVYKDSHQIAAIPFKDTFI